MAYNDQDPTKNNPQPIAPPPLPPMKGNTLTSSEFEDRERAAAQKEQFNSLVNLAGVAGIGYVGGNIANNNEDIRSFVARLPGANRYSAKDKLAREEAIKLGIDIPDLTDFYKRQSIGKSIHSMISSVEELSPLNILKTLQFSNAVEPLVDISKDIRSAPVNITSDSVRNFQDLYTSMIEKASGGARTLTSRDLASGFFLQDGVLYAVQPDGTVDYNDPVLKKAKLVTSSVKVGDHYSPNRIVEKYANIHGVGLSRDMMAQGHSVVIGEESASKLTGTWAKSYLRYAMEIGYKTLDNPLGGMEDLLSTAGLGNTNFFQNPTYQKIKSKLNLSLGTQGRYDLSTKESLKIVSKNLAIKSAKYYIGYNAINAVLDKITPENSVWNNGILSGITGTYANLRIGLAGLWSDKFQNYKKSQEQGADGSTNLTTLLGFPAVGAMAGASFEYYKRLYVSGTKSIEEGSAQAAREVGYGIFDSIFKKAGLKNTTPMKSRATIGAVIGGALALPFLPGALIGKSSDELRDEYTGKREVENRANAGWIMGGSAYEGDSVKNFQASKVARILANSKNIVRYGDNETKRDLDPIFSPFAYLQNPYKFEEMHKDDMPYPVWGMDVNYGSFLGKIFQGTVGEVIKPTVVNKDFLDTALAARKKLLGKERAQQGAPQQQEGSSDELVTAIAGTFQQDYTTYSSRPGETTAAPRVREEKVHTVNIGGVHVSGDIGKEAAVVQALGNTVVGNQVLKRTQQYQNNANDYAIPVTTGAKDSAMIREGLMIAPESPSSDPQVLAASKAFGSLTDFTGAKGFASNLTMGALGFDPSHVKLQLARSGSATSGAKDFKDENLGDLLGLGEAQRRLMPTSAGAAQAFSNPMSNFVSTSWMPADESKFYIDFSKGNYYGNVALGESRLAGKGYEAIHKELQGTDTEKYPLVYKYKILSDTALGSAEQISMREMLLQQVEKNKLNAQEKDIFFSTLEQEQVKSRKKTFSEYKTGSERASMSTYQNVLATLWEPIVHNSESVLEPLTPLRPGAKFIHKRTAIEDYEKTQLAGPDTGIWTNPYSHFLKPALNRIVGLASPDPFVPEEAKERDRVNEYFDKLAYIKARKNGDTNAALRTVIGSSFAGLTDMDGMNKFRAALVPDQKAYVDSFASETNKKKREQILAMLPKDVGMAYQTIWHNLGVANKAGNAKTEAVKRDYIATTSKYVKAAGGTTAELSPATQTSPANMDNTIRKNNYKVQSKNSGKVAPTAFDKAKEKRLQAADKVAIDYVNRSTGMPSKDWIGWDPRLTMNDVKLRTLSVGKADMFRFGFWDSDLDRNKRIVALDESRQVTNDYGRIIKGISDERAKKQKVENILFRHGFVTSNIQFNKASENEIRIQNKQGQ